MQVQTANNINLLNANKIFYYPYAKLKTDCNEYKSSNTIT